MTYANKFIAHLVRAFLLLSIFYGTAASGAEFSVTTDMHAQDVFRAMQNDELVLIDVRTPDEWRNTGIAKGANPISMQDVDFLTKLAQLTDENPGKPVAFICASGRRSGIVQAELTRRGYQGMFSVYGGTTGSSEAPGWIGEGLPVVAWHQN